MNEPVCDVFVRFKPRGRYTVYGSAVSLGEAHAMVYELREREDVDWAYCSEPREDDAAAPLAKPGVP